MTVTRGVQVALIVVASCGGTSEPPATPAAEPDPPFLVTLATALDAGTVTVATPEEATVLGVSAGGEAGGEQAARALLAPFVAPRADHEALTRSLRPTSADYDALFDAEVARQIESSQALGWDAGNVLVKPADPKQTDIQIWSATGAELAAGTGDASHFPGGYRKIGKHLAPAVKFHAFKLVEPGKSSGTAYDGLAFVNGHWVIVPKPWRALDATRPARPHVKNKTKKRS